MDLDLIEIWPTKISEVTVPNETDLAPLITEAFIKGGNEKEGLFIHNDDNIAGSFGVTAASAFVFPIILQCIATTAELLKTILHNFELAHAVYAASFQTIPTGCVTLGQILGPAVPIRSLIELSDRIKKANNKSSVTPEKTEFLTGELDVNLKKVLETFTNEMSESGISKIDSERIAYNTILKLLEDPSNSIKFVKAVSKFPEK
jgi:hypothetical protein